MAVTIVPGIAAAARARNTRNSDLGAAVPLEHYAMSDEIYVRNGKAAPFTTFLEDLSFQTDADDVYRWKEDELVPQRDTLSGSVLNAAVNLNVTNVAYWTIDDTLYIHAYNAEGLVTGINQATGVVTVSWVVAPVAANIPANTIITRQGNAHEQIAIHNLMPTTIAADVSNVYQDLRHGTGCSVQHYNGNFQFRPGDWELQMDKAEQEHQLAKEKTLLFGQQALWQVGNSPRGFNQGLYYFGATHRTSVAGVITQPVLDQFLGTVMLSNEQPDQEWWFMVAARLQMQISQLAQPLERTDTTKSQFGMGITQYKAPTNEVVNIVTHPLFHREGYSDLGILFNRSRRNVYGVYHKGMATKRHRSIQPYGRSAMEEFFWTDLTLCFKGESINMGIMDTVTASAGSV